MLIHGACIHARYSTDNQEQDSIEVQVEKCAEWCQKNNIPVVDVFPDYAISGMKDTRPQYARMMEFLKQGRADTVVIYDQSRMFRKLTAWFEFREELENLGVRVVSVTQPMIGGDLKDPSNFLMEGSMALFNQMWVLQTRQKVVEKMRFMAKEGRHTGGQPPYGYVVKDGKLAIDPDEAAIVQRIFGLVDSGVSYRGILQQLNADGVKTKRGNAFGTNSLHDLLKNKKYIGIYTYGKVAQRPNGSRNSHQVSSSAIEIPGGCPQIIDRDLFDRVQIKLEKRRHTGGPKPKNGYALHGKVFCGKCLSPMHIKYSWGESKYAYYICTAQKRNHVCDASPVRASSLEADVVAGVKERILDPGNLDRLFAFMRKQRNSAQEAACSKLSVLIDRRREINRQLENASAAVLQGLTSQTLIDKIHGLENEKASIDYEMRQLKKEAETTDFPDNELEVALKALLENMQEDDQAVLSIVCRVEVFDDHLNIWTILDGDPTPAPTKKGTIPPSELPEPGRFKIAHNRSIPPGSTKRKRRP